LKRLILLRKLCKLCIAPLNSPNCITFLTIFPKPISKIILWLGSNLLCLRTDQWIVDDKDDPEPIRQCANLLSEGNQQQEMTIMSQILQMESIIRKIEGFAAKSSTESSPSPKCGILDLIYRTQADGCHLSRLVIWWDKNELRLECDDYQLLLTLVQSFIIDHLKLRVTPDSITTNLLSGEDNNGLKPILDDLENVSKNSRNLEKSERRVQTELYEAADHILNLMDQFYIAQQISEFSTAKDLLSEITMIFDGAQNSAKAFYLNNRERLKLSRDACQLREKISFLLGD